MKVNIITILFLLFSPIACAQEILPAKHPIYKFDENLKEHLFLKFDDFQITEIFSKDAGKRQFLKNSLGEGFTTGLVGVESREILFKALSEKTESHIGIAVLVYADEQSAKNAIKTIEKSSYFENTKILTKYISDNKGRENIVLYTESAADKLALDYMGQYFSNQ